MRALGIDLGTKRIGIAVSDSSATVAGPLTVLARTGDRASDHRRIAQLVAEEEATVVVVGLPLSMNGEVGVAAQGAIDEAEMLASVVGVDVQMWDERLTTVSADRVLLQAGLNAGARRKVVDKVAAAVMLQGWLDRQHEANR